MKTSGPILRLPVEILQNILSFVPDVVSLKNAVLSSSLLYRAFFDAETSITPKVLIQQISIDVLPEAMKRFESADVRTAQESITFLRQLRDRNFISLSDRDLQLWSLRKALRIGKFHSLVTDLAREFLVQAESDAPPGLFEAGISDLERYRIQRALYRFEIYRNVFPLSAGEQLIELEDHWQLFFSHFAPWENEQLGCIHDFLVRLVLPSFSDVSEHDVDWGASHIDYDVFDSPFIQYTLSLGLETIARIGGAKTYEDRYRALDADQTPDLTFEFLQEKLSEANKDYDSSVLDYPYGIVAFFHELDTGPEDVWRWAHPEDQPFYWVYEPKQDILRKWGYVMWNRARLDQVRLFDESFAAMDAKRDHESEKHEVIRQQGYMSNSWDQRENVQRRGGAGWWSWGNESKLTWRDKGITRTNMAFRPPSTPRDPVPQSLNDAREFLASMTLPLSARR